MMNSKYLILRRIFQIGLLTLFVGGNVFGWKILEGNYSTALVFDSFHLSDPYAVLQMLATFYVPLSEVIIGALILFFFYALVGGRAFCSWVCPINIITDLAAALQRKYKIKPLLKTRELSRNIRYYVLVLGLILSGAFGIAAFELINPITVLHRALIFGIGFSSSIVLIVFLFDLLILEHGYCGHICPVGALYAATGRFRAIKVFHDKDNCTLCMKCKKVCPEPQVLGLIGKETAKIKTAECTNCARCIDVCDDDALKFKL